MRHADIIRFVLLTALCLFMAMADLGFGSTSIPCADIWTALGGGSDAVTRSILFDLRLPRLLTAILAGAGLSTAGLLMQTLFQNPLAGPYILGVSSGSTLGVALCTMTAASLGFAVANAWISILAAISGATAILLVVLAVSHRVRSAVSLLIVGLMVGSIAGAVVNVIQNYADPDSLKLFITWTLGSLSVVGWKQLAVLAPLSLVGLAVSLLLIKPMNGLLLGENYAQGLGIDIRRTRFLIILATGILAGTITAFTGPIAFVGVAVPHIARGLFRTANHRTILPATILTGATLLLTCDVISQIPTYAIPISTITSLFGAPIILYIVLRKN